MRLVERRGHPGDASACSGASCSFRPGALCGMRTRTARGMSLVEGVGGGISATGPGFGMGDDWGHGVDTSPGGCGHGTDTGPGGCGHGTDTGPGGCGHGTDTGPGGCGHGTDTGPGGCGHGTDTGPGGCGFGTGQSWELGGRGRSDWGSGLVVAGETEASGWLAVQSSGLEPS